LSSTLNDAAFAARQVVVQDTYPAHIQQRNPSFINAALHVTKATKQNLTVTLEDQLKKPFLQRLATGGTETATRAPKLAVPAPDLNAKRTARGMPPRWKRQAIIAATPRRALRVTPTGVFVGQGGRLKLMYSLKPSVHVPKIFNFYETWEYVVMNYIRTSFAANLRRAMDTRR
jgi:hypothetical protein